MKKQLSVFSMIVLVAALFGRGLDGRIEASRPDNSVSENRTVFTFEEDFEAGPNDWTHIDGTLPTAMWHVYRIPNSIPANYIWWMGDEDIGGYLDHQYVYLDTDEIAVPTGGHLTFSLNYATEEPGTNTAAPEYNGWDGCNVRISTDGGTSWQVIAGAPAYDVTSLYSFGGEFGEGPNVPGWAGTSDGWVDADFDLSTYAGQDVRIRFAFASDPETNTTANDEWFGMAIDNIQLGDYSNNGEETGMTPGTMLPTAGDFWALTQPAGGAASPLYAFTCLDGDSYPQGVYNILESRPYPTQNFGYYGGRLTADFKIKGSFVNEPGTYWLWQVKGYTDNTWRNMTNPTGSSTGQNLAFGSPLADEWVSVSDLYPGLSGRLDNFNGDTVTFRIIFVSSATTQPQGAGIMIDDFSLSMERFTGPPPVNLQASTLGNGYVSLSWNSIDLSRVQSFNLYHGMHQDGPWELIETLQDSFYMHINPVADELNYYTVTTLFSDDDESDYAPAVGTFVPVQGAMELRQDDGTAEERFSTGPMNLIATKLYSPDPLAPVYAGVYVDSLRDGPLVIKMWDDDGPSGRPGTELLTPPFSVSASELELGWNFFALPPASVNGVVDGYFYVGILETADASYIGVDTANSGFSYHYQGESWLPITQGTLMLRAVVAPTASAGNAVASSPQTTLWNAPNPFHPGSSQRSVATTIHFNIPGQETAAVQIFNIRGQRLLNQTVRLNNGEGLLNWNGLDTSGNPTASGLYLYTVQSGKTTISQKMMVIK
jgi:hypothetical protein